MLARIINTVVDDFDREGRQPAMRAKYRILVDSLAVENEGRSIAELAGAPFGEATASVETSLAEVRAAPLTPQLGMSLSDISAMIRHAVQDAQFKPESRRLLSEALPAYLAQKHKELKGNKHFDEICSKLTIFVKVVGDKPIHAYTQSDMRNY